MKRKGNDSSNYRKVSFVLLEAVLKCEGSCLIGGSVVKS